MDMNILEQIGLTRSEIKVYLALLELGVTTTGPIVNKSGASSSKIYEILDRLIKKGLVSYIRKGKTKNFEAAPPSRILDYFKEKDEELDRQRKQVEQLLPELEIKRQLSKHQEEATIYKGMKGVETAFYDALKLMKKGETFYVYGIPPRSDKINYFFVKWNKERAKLGIKAKQLFNESARGELQALPENNPLSQIKVMQQDQVMPVGINIFNDQVILFPSETEKQPLLIVINNKEIAQSFKTQFDIFWNQQTKIFTGLEGPRFVLKDMVETGHEILAFGLEEYKLQDQLPKELLEFKREVEKKNILERLLFKEGTKITVLPKGSAIRYLPEEYFSPLHGEIYGNKVAIFDWSEPITTIIIDKKAIAEGFRKYFELLWNIAKP
ncbi:hypothetical protein JW756_00215 [Candidatus Woesearchaeota archaeon]|nr:hypothetical protein [Candidatus Woesearchaeota archaeon]